MVGPKLVCINLQPYTTGQAPDRGDILNIGGFSDAVFKVVASFLASDAVYAFAGASRSNSSRSCCW
jgi:60 kDa SS-A/Ro ribonucleoprotein